MESAFLPSKAQFYWLIGLNLVLIFIVLIGFGRLSKSKEALLPEEKKSYGESLVSSKPACNVLGVALRGYLQTSPLAPKDSNDNFSNNTEEISTSTDILNKIEQAEEDDSIKAIVLEVDSYGGGVVTGEEIANALKRSSKLTTALIREKGTSAAYWAATGAQKIFASALSDIGGIGVTMSYVDYSLKNVQDGLTFNQLSTGKFKDAGSQEKSLTEPERTLFMRDLQLLHEKFVLTVSENRHLPLEKVKEMADGSSMLGLMAKDKGLIDEIGDLSSVKDYLKKKLAGTEVVICW